MLNFQFISAMFLNSVLYIYIKKKKLSVEILYRNRLLLILN